MMSTLSRPIEAVLFDLDDTLSDRRLALRNYAHAFALTHLNEARDRARCSEGTANETDKCVDFFINQFMQLDGHGFEPRINLFTELMDDFKLDIDPQKLAESWVEDFAQFATLSAGAMDVLRHLNPKYKLGLITNGSKRAQANKFRTLGLNSWQALTERTGLSERAGSSNDEMKKVPGTETKAIFQDAQCASSPIFDVVLTADDVLEPKPHPELFRKAASQLAVPIESCVYVGNDYRCDVLGSGEAGMLPIWYRLDDDPYPASSFDERLTISHLRELQGML
jgi:putative hydrolase of the HAD superfamily